MSTDLELTKTAAAGSSPGAKPAYLERGTGLGRYVLLEPLGAGGMGVVYAAFDGTLDRRVALKLLHDRDATDAQLSRFEREAKAMAQVRHPNVLAIHELGRHEGRTFIAMELVNGATLADWLRERPRSWREVVEVFRAAGLGLAAAHAAHLVHRDFKPANVLIGDDGRVQVTDFGLARLGVGLPDPSSALTEAPVAISPSALTQAGAILGTPRYMSPEQLSGDEATDRSDQFSFCVSLFEALYAELPFEGPNLGAFLQKMMAGELTAPARMREVPRFVYEVLARGLRAKPDERWPSMTALLDALSRDPAARRRRVLNGVAVATAMGLVLGGAALVEHRGRASCVGLEHELGGAWDGQRRAEVQRAFSAIHKPFADDAADRVAKRLDALVGDWGHARTDVCLATRRNAVEPELAARQLDCLRLVGHELNALTRAFTKADEKMITRAVAATYSLTPVSSCADVRALLAAPKRAPERAEQIQALEAELSELTVEFRAVGGLGLVDRSRTLVERAKALGSRDLEAKALVLQGLMLSYGGEALEADKVLKRAVLAAQASADHRVLAKAWLYLAQSKAVDQGKVEEGEEALQFAAAALEAAGEPELTRLNLLEFSTLVKWVARRIPEALADAKAAMALAETLADREPSAAIDLASVRSNLGGLLQEHGEPAAAAVELEKAVADTERVEGPTNPHLIEPLMNLSLALNGLPERPNHRAEAEAVARRALKIAEDAYGADSVRCANPLVNLAMQLNGSAKHAEAAQVAAAAVARFETEGINPRPYLTALGEQARALAEVGQPGPAREAWRKLEQAITTQEHPDPSDTSLLASLSGRIAQTAGDKRTALAEFGKAIDGMAKGAGDPLELARLRFDWARLKVELEPKQRAPALEAAKAAREALAAAKYSEEVAAIDAWTAAFH